MKYDKDRHTRIAGCVLTFGSRNGIVPGYGEMSERFKEPVLKTGDGATHRGFESHSLRQRITVILIQRNDGYFIPKISILRTFEGANTINASNCRIKIVKS